MIVHVIKSNLIVSRSIISICGVICLYTLIFFFLSHFYLVTGAIGMPAEQLSYYGVFSILLCCLWLGV